MVTGPTPELIEATLTLHFNRGELTPYCVLVLEGQDSYSKEVNATGRVPQAILQAARKLLADLAFQEGATLATAQPPGVV